MTAELFDKYMKKLEECLEKNPKLDEVLSKVEERTKLKKTYLVIILVGVLISWLAAGYAGQLICNAIGFLYPAYASIKAIESTNKDDDTKWLTYWVVFAAFSLVETFSDIIVGWMPFYWLGKCLFLLWCMSPLNGSTIVYNTVLLPAFRQNEEAIDKVVNQSKEKFTELTEKALKEASSTTTPAEQAEMKRD